MNRCYGSIALPDPEVGKRSAEAVQLLSSLEPRQLLMVGSERECFGRFSTFKYERDPDQTFEQFLRAAMEEEFWWRTSLIVGAHKRGEL